MPRGSVDNNEEAALYRLKAYNSRKNNTKPLKEWGEISPNQRQHWRRKWRLGKVRKNE